MLFTKDTMAKNLLLPHVGHSKLSTKQKESNFPKKTPLEALVDREGWKVSMFKDMYITIMHVLIQGIWLKGSHVICVAKKLMVLVTLVKIGMHIN